MAGRYLNPVRSHISVITLISMIGVMLGVTVLIVVLSVHAGFEREVKKLMLGFAPHVEIQSPWGPLKNYEELGEQLKQSSGVTGSYAMIEDYVLLDAPNYRKPVLYRAVDTADEDQTQALKELLDLESYPGSRADMGLDEYTVISRQLAQSLNLSIGDEVQVFASRNFEAVKDIFAATNEDPLKVRAAEELSSLLAIIEKGEEQGKTPEFQEFYGRIQMLEEQTGRVGEIELIQEMLFAIEDGAIKDESGDFYRLEPTMWAQLQSALIGLQEFDEVSADAQVLKGMKEIVLPKSLKVWGVYRDTQRTPGPAMFIPLPVGQELKGFEGGAELLALRLHRQLLDGKRRRPSSTPGHSKRENHDESRALTHWHSFYL